MIVLLLLLLCLSNSYQENDKCSNFPKVVTDHTEEACKAKGPEWYYVKKRNCFPTCEYYPYTSATGYACEDDSDCVPGYACDDYCYSNDDCFQYYAYVVQNPYYDKYWKPKCSKDGNWAAKQCKGEATTGRCFCFDEKGKRLFGQQWITEAENMTCSCSRQKATLKKNDTVWYSSLHCDRTGNYEALQCDSGICWCADPEKGEPISTIVPDVSMKKLPCFRTVDIGNQYLRQCDSQKYAQMYIDHLFKQHGTMFSNFPLLLCDEDGTYGPYKIDNGQAYCTWRDNSFIPNYQSTVSMSTNNLTCNCARDKKYFAEVGKQLTQICLGNGEYDPSQSTGKPGVYYCVDKDGYKNYEGTTTDQNFCKNQQA